MTISRREFLKYCGSAAGAMGMSASGLMKLQNVLAAEGWVVPYYMQVIGTYMKSLEKYPNPAPVNLTEFRG